MVLIIHAFVHEIIWLPLSATVLFVHLFTVMVPNTIHLPTLVFSRVIYDYIYIIYLTEGRYKTQFTKLTKELIASIYFNFLQILQKYCDHELVW